MSKNIIEFGNWNDFPIEWLVLEENETSLFLVSKEDLFDYCFNQNTNDGNSWSDSQIRHYLNTEFWDEAFSDEEKERVINTLLPVPNSTKDNVFLLSKAEAEEFLTNEERCLGMDWWLRNQPLNNTNCSFFVDNEGKLSWNYVRYHYGIRPAIYIKK